MRNGLGYVGNTNAKVKQQSKRPETNGIMVLTDFCANSCLLELICVSSSESGVKITLRTEQNEHIEVDSFRDIRKAFPNELMARARQGSERFNEYWAKNRHQYY